MFGQFFSTSKNLILVTLILSGLISFELSADTSVLNLMEIDNQYIGKYLYLISEKDIFENVEELNEFPQDMQHVLLSGVFSSNPNIQVRIRRAESIGYKAELNYLNSDQVFHLSWGIEDLMNNKISGKFVSSENEIPVLDFSEHAQWMKLQIYNPENKTRDLILQLDKNIYSWFDLHYFLGDELISLYGSFEDPMSQRSIQESKITLPIKAIPGITTVYMRMESQFFDSVPLKIYDSVDFSRINNRNKFFHGFVSGITIILLAYALYLSYSFWEKGYLYLALLILVGYFIHISESGLGMILFWPEDPMISVFLFSIAMPLTIILNLIFCRYYLTTQKQFPRIDILFLVISFTALSLLIIQFFIPIYSRYGFTIFSILLDYISVIPLLIAAILLYKKINSGNRSGLFISAAIGFQLLSYIEFWLSRMNLLPLGLIDFIHMRSIGFAIVMLSGVKYKMKILEGTISNLKAKLTEIIETKEKNTKNLTDSTQVKVEAVKELIEKSFTEPLYRDDLATSVGLSPDHLGRMFKKLTGEKISDFIGRLRIEEACRLLEDENRKIIDIAFDVGFENLRTFNHSFSKFKNMSPSDYRRDYLNRPTGET